MYDVGMGAGADDTIYIYDCTICKKEVRRWNVLKCIICKKKVCANCYVKGVCKTHYEMLTDEGKNEFEKTHKLNKSKINKLTAFEVLFGVFWLAIFILIMIGQINVMVNSSYAESSIGILIFSIIFLLIILAIIIIFFEIKKSGLRTELVNELIKLFQRQGITANCKEKISDKSILYPSKKEKSCPFCQRKLRNDSIYCDICGLRL